MPRFYFDHRDHGRLWMDDEGLEFASVEAARQTARRALGELARDALLDDGERELAIAVRDESGAAILALALSLKVSDPGPDPS